MTKIFAFIFALLATLDIAHAQGGNRESIINPDDLEIEQVFKNENGDMFVLFKPGPRRLGSYRMFWGPSDEGKLYQLKQGASGEGAGQYYFVFLAPVEGNLDREAKVQVTNDGELTVSCEGNSICFQEFKGFSNWWENMKLERQIRNGSIQVIGLPPVRSLRHIFQITGTDTYITIDSPKLESTNDYRVYVGKRGSMSQMEIEDVKVYRQAGALIISFSDESIIHIPSEFVRENTPIFTDSSGKETPLIELERSLEFLSDTLGMDTSDYEMPMLRNPVTDCGMTLSKTEPN